MSDRGTHTEADAGRSARNNAEPDALDPSDAVEPWPAAWHADPWLREQSARVWGDPLP